MDSGTLCLQLGWLLLYWGATLAVTLCLIRRFLIGIFQSGGASGLPRKFYLYET